MAVNKAYSSGTEKSKKSYTKNYKRYPVAQKPVNKTQIYIYIINTVVLTFIGFIAGYNIKAMQVQKSAGTTILATSEYIRNAEKKSEEAAALISELKNFEVHHFRGKSGNPSSGTKTSGRHVSAKKNGYTAKAPRTAKGVPVYHRVEKGEMLSMLVSKAHMDNFLSLNPNISDPDAVHPGQRILLDIPYGNIKSGIYMDDYFIQPLQNSSGNRSYRLVKWLEIPKNESMLQHFIKKNSPSIKNSTIAYISLADFANRIKAEMLLQPETVISHENKINKIRRSFNSIFFQAIKHDTFFRKNRYAGIHLNSDSSYQDNLDVIKDFLIRYLVYAKSAGRKNPFYHFMIFDGTIVQTDFLENKFFTESRKKPKIRIALVYYTDRSKTAIFQLEGALTTCKVDRGEIVEVNDENIRKFK